MSSLVYDKLKNHIESYFILYAAILFILSCILFFTVLYPRFVAPIFEPYILLGTAIIASFLFVITKPRDILYTPIFLVLCFIGAGLVGVYELYALVGLGAIGVFVYTRNDLKSISVKNLFRSTISTILLGFHIAVYWFSISVAVSVLNNVSGVTTPQTIQGVYGTALYPISSPGISVLFVAITVSFVQLVDTKNPISNKVGQIISPTSKLFTSETPVYTKLYASLYLSFIFNRSVGWVYSKISRNCVYYVQGENEDRILLFDSIDDLAQAIDEDPHVNLSTRECSHDSDESIEVNVYYTKLRGNILKTKNEEQFCYDCFLEDVPRIAEETDELSDSVIIANTI